MHPIRTSANGRYFTDPTGNPVFWLGTTQWQLFREFTLDEAQLIIEKSKTTGFDFIQVMLLGVGDGTKPNLNGEKPCHNDDPDTPNEAYFQHVDAVMEIARKSDVAISMTVFHQRYRDRITLEKARAWATWLAERYGHFPNLVWSMTPRATEEFVPILRELAAGLKAGDSGAHLVTFKPDPAPYTSSFIHNEDWLDFNCMQTWRSVELIYPMITNDYHLLPTKPVVMAEGAYENGTEYSFDVTPLWVRRQAYYSYLSGASHTYGHNDSWRVLPTWKQALDAPGAAQLGILKKIFIAQREWWELVPDQSLFDKGGQVEGTVLNLSARHKDNRWGMVYLADQALFSIRLDKFSGSVNVFWIDPITGVRHPAGHFSNAGVASFSTPSGWEDALLVLSVAE